MPTYNRVDTLGQAIESVLVQTFRDFELLVIDDGSTDATPDLMTCYCDPRVQYLRLPQNRGVAHARNHGIRQARAELVAFLDSDDEWLPVKLERQMAYLAATDRPDLGLIFSAAEVLNAAGNAVGIIEPSFPPAFLDRPLEEIIARLFIGNFCWIGTVMMKKVCFERLGRFAEDLSGSDEYEYWLRLAGTYRMAYISEVLARYRTHEAGITGTFNRSGTAYAHRVEIARRAAARYPFLRPLLGERIATWSRAYAHQLLLNGDNRQARRAFWQAIRSQPNHWATYFAWLLSALGGPGRQVYCSSRQLAGRA